MSTTTSSLRAVDVRPAWLARTRDYVELTKPKIGLLVLATVAVSAFVASWGQPNPWHLAAALLGTALIAASASAMNHYLERESDAHMDRTANRPLPGGRLSEREVLTFAALTVAAGLVCLASTVGWATAAMGMGSWLMYVVVYTPLKSRTSLNTLVGAIGGAMPVLIGWLAGGGALDLRAATLFFIVFLWQFPHFMAIAWLYRNEYATARLKMLTVVEPSGVRAGVQAVIAALALLLVSLAPAAATRPAGSVYLVVAFLLGIAQLACAVRFFRRRSYASARLLLRASLVYLPALLLLLMLIPLM